MNDRLRSSKDAAEANFTSLFLVFVGTRFYRFRTGLFPKFAFKKTTYTPSDG